MLSIRVRTSITELNNPPITIRIAVPEIASARILNASGFTKSPAMFSGATENAAMPVK